MGKDLVTTDSHLMPRQISSGQPIIQIKSLPFQTIKSHSPWEGIDDEPVIWFGPIVIAGLAMLMTVGGVIFGLVAFFQRFI